MQKPVRRIECDKNHVGRMARPTRISFPPTLEVEEEKSLLSDCDPKPTKMRAVKGIGLEEAIFYFGGEICQGDLEPRIWA